jgi:RNA ligase
MEKELLKKMVDEGYVSIQKHPTEDLFIHNYTKKAQYEWSWNEVTKKCRGLIMGGKGEIISNPFEKFFNLEELDNKKHKIPNESFEVYEKMDGSLGILYWVEDVPAIATRGSFVSKQAFEGTKILLEKYQNAIKNLDSKKTYLFEIIYPKNRIVIDYGDKRDLILLAIRDTKTGKEYPLEDIGFPIVKRYGGIKDFRKLKELEEDNKEGFVIKFKSGFRMKIKFEEYKRLHRIFTNVSNKSIWEILKDGGDFKELIERVPDEFFNWLEDTKNGLLRKYKQIEDISKKNYRSPEEFESMKDFAEYTSKQVYPSVLFQMKSNKDYSEYIWKIIKPEYARPFKEEDSQLSRGTKE